MAAHSAYKIHIQGLVQGVGFRPFIYRLANHHRLSGWVINRNDGVVVKVMAGEKEVRDFIDRIRSQAPGASRITSIHWQESEAEDLSGFQIVSSQDASREVTQVSPDIAVCDHCLEDMRRQPHRINYPFINCTHCGPRFSIIRDLPYDRSHTTMAGFRMCPRCEEEYHDVDDRRFHAQPIACNECGPRYEYYQQGRIIRDMKRMMEEVGKSLEKGRIVALKGIGGFHLMCDATNEKSVARLRRIKRRDARPFACMFADMQTLERYAHLDEQEQKSLSSWRRPIVLLDQKKELAPSVTMQLNTLGAMLPYMPLHQLLFQEVNLPALVMTSANISDEPLIVNNQAAHEKFSEEVDAFLFHNRPIHNRVDDSVVRIMDGIERPVRRSRGYAPEPIDTGLQVDGILATGGELKNVFCVGKGQQAVMSQHIGDLQNHEVYEFYMNAVRQFLQLFRVEPRVVVSDMHPEYRSTRFARSYTGQYNRTTKASRNGQLKHLQVQHHHAHIASCMSEHGLDEKVIGVALDGNGYGDDGRVWGGEFLVCDLSGYTRYTHLQYMPMPGGDKVTGEPWRMALAYLYHSFGEDLYNLDLDFMAGKAPEDIKLIVSMMRKGIQSPLTSSAGRLFDAVSALLNVCTHSRYEAEAAMRLESITRQDELASYTFDLTPDGIGFGPMFREITGELQDGVAPSVIASRFHNTVARASLAVIREIHHQTGLNKVVLSGGTFQNRYLSERLSGMLQEESFDVFRHSRVPSNDGGLALGQLAIASRMIHQST